MSVQDLIDILPIPIILIDSNSHSIHTNSRFNTATGFKEKSIDWSHSLKEKMFISEEGELSLAELAEKAAGTKPVFISFKARGRDRHRVSSTLAKSGNEDSFTVLIFEQEYFPQDHFQDNLKRGHPSRMKEKGYSDLEKEISEKTYELSLLYEISKAMNSSQSLEDFVRFILEAVNRMSGSDCSFMLVTLDNAPVIFFSLARFIGEEAISAIKESVLSHFSELSSRKSQEPQIVIYRSTDYLSDIYSTEVLEVPHMVPLFRKSFLAGMIGICTSHKRVVDENRVRLLYTISNQASATLDRFLSSREAEQSRFRSVVNSMTEGVVLTDLNSYVLMANPAADAIISKLELRRDGGFVESMRSRTLTTGIAHMKKGKTRSVNEEIAFGKYQTILSLTASPFLDSKDTITGIVFVFSDVTRQKQLQERMIQTEKLSALGELISGVAHELNNPLASVIGYAQLLKNAQVSSDVKKKVEIINSESKRCQRIVQDLLTFARKHKFEKKRIDINSTIDSVLQLIAYQLKVNGIKIEKNYSNETPRIIADFHQIQQVFLNLLNNAIQALGEVKRKRWILIRTEISDGNVIVEVQDNGPGIREENLGKVFDPFFTTKEAGSGTGLGLSIARGTVREHGGDIEVSGAYGEGTSFIARFPSARDAKVKEQEPALPDSVRVIPKGKRILVVDDEKEMFNLIEEALRVDEHIVGYACDGSAALKELKESAFDLIISDFKMPTIGGKELFALINRQFPHLKDKFIFITGDTANPVTNEFIKKKKAPLLAKPFDVDDIRKAVRERFLKS